MVASNASLVPSAPTGAAGSTFFSSVATLAPLPMRPYQDIDGYAAVGDGGEGRFEWNATSTAFPDGGTVVQVAGIATGRWLRSYSGALNFGWFGGNPSRSDNLSAWNQMMAAKDAIAISRLSVDPRNASTRVYVPGGSGRYRMSGPADFGQFPFVMDGDGAHTNAGDAFGSPTWDFPRQVLNPLAVPGSDIYGTVFYFYNQTDGFTWKTLYQSLYLNNFAIVGSTCSLFVVAGSSFTIPRADGTSTATLTVRWYNAQPSPVLPSIPVGQNLYVAGTVVPGITGGGQFSFRKLTDLGNGNASLVVMNTGASINLAAGTVVTAPATGLGISKSQVTRGLQSNCVSANNILGNNIKIFNFWEGFQPGAVEGQNMRNLTLVGNDIGVAYTGVCSGGKTGGIGTTGPNSTNLALTASFIQPAVGSTISGVKATQLPDPIAGYTDLSTLQGSYVTVGSLFAHSWYLVTEVSKTGHDYELTLKNAGFLGTIPVRATVPVGALFCKGVQGSTDNQMDYITWNRNRIALYALLAAKTKIFGGSCQGNAVAWHFATTPWQGSGDVTLNDIWCEGNGLTFGNGPDMVIDVSYNNISAVYLNNMHGSGGPVFNQCIGPLAGFRTGCNGFHFVDFNGAQVVIPPFAEGWSIEGPLSNGVMDNGRHTQFVRCPPYPLGNNAGSFTQVDSASPGYPIYTVRNDPAQQDHMLGVATLSPFAITIVLPSDPHVKDGDSYVIKDIQGNAAKKNITVLPGASAIAAGHIDGASSYVIRTNWGSATFYLVARNGWMVIGQN